MKQEHAKAVSYTHLIMPPIMGAAAFVLSDVAGVPYAEVCIAAILPALMYYICLLYTSRKGDRVSRATIHWAGSNPRPFLRFSYGSSLVGKVGLCYDRECGADNFEKDR